MSDRFDLQAMTPELVSLRIQWLMAKYWETRVAPFRDGKPDAWERSRRLWRKFAASLPPPDMEMLDLVRAFVWDDPLAVPLWRHSWPEPAEVEGMTQLGDAIIAHYLPADDLYAILCVLRAERQIAEDVPNEALHAVADTISGGHRRRGELIVEVASRVLRPWIKRWWADAYLPYIVARVVIDSIPDLILLETTVEADDDPHGAASQAEVDLLENAGGDHG